MGHPVVQANSFMQQAPVVALEFLESVKLFILNNKNAKLKAYRCLVLPAHKDSQSSLRLVHCTSFAMECSNVVYLQNNYTQ